MMDDSVRPEQKRSAKNIAVSGTFLLSMIFSLYLYFRINGEGVFDFFSRVDGHFYWMIIFMLPLPISFWITKRWPADKDQNLFSSGFRLDLVYHFVRFASSVSLLVAVMPAAKLFYDRFLGFLTIEVSAELPVWLRVILLALFVDILGWVNHYLRHRIKIVWHFHSVHHSQPDLNYFTDSRVHVFERFLSTLIVFIPAFMVQIPAPSVVILLTLLSYQRFFYHSNWKSNFGILRYVLVTPQSHRIHHSRLPEHQNKNFGVNFSIWDHLFGTQYRNYDDYPETGIADANFPVEKGRGLLDIADSFGAQFLYPFEVIFDGFRRRGQALLRRADKVVASWILPH